MFTMFNGKTVYDGTSMKEFNLVRNVLEANGIPYQYKTLDMERNSWRGPMGGVTRDVGANFSGQPSLMYEIVVGKKDYERAACLAVEAVRNGA